MSADQNDRNAELDRFWDIERLVPPKKKSAKPSAISPHRTEAVAVSTPSSPKREDTHSENVLTLSKNATSKQTTHSIYAEYSASTPFVHQVKILNWKSTYNYYDFFCRQAASLYKKRGNECPKASFSPYFSYVAQYSQLNRRQLDWYLWWRECVRNKIYLKTDVSYIHLLIYEIINLGESIDTVVSADILLSLWRNYKEEFPQLNGTLAEWLSDYSLIHRVPIPYQDQAEEAAFLAISFLPEAFCSFSITDVDRLTSFLLSACSAYDYKKSKFYTSENARFYDHYIPYTLRSLLERMDLPAWLASRPTKRISRMAFTGALCASQRRKHIEIEYTVLCSSHEIRSFVGDVVKHTENKLRNHLGIRSKLNVHVLSQEIKDTLDLILRRSPLERESQTKQIPEYEKLYDAKETEISIESALGIERASWEITERLVEAFEEEAPQAEPEQISETIQEVPAPADQEQAPVDHFLSMLGSREPFFQLVLRQDFPAQKDYIKENRILPDAIADEINEIAVEIFGDILIEQDDVGNYRILDDYHSIFE